MENLVDDTSSEGLVTFPDEQSDGDLPLELSPDDQLQNVVSSGLGSSDTVKFEQKRMMNSSKTKILTNGFSSEQVRSGKTKLMKKSQLKFSPFQATTNAAEVKKLQSGDLEFKEAKSVAAMRNRMEVDGVKTEEANAVLQVRFSLKYLLVSSVFLAWKQQKKEKFVFAFASLAGDIR